MAKTENDANEATEKKLPNWCYNGVSPDQHQHLPGDGAMSYPPLEGPYSVDLGVYSRKSVTNLDDNGKGRAYFDLGLRLMLSYQHEMAARSFLAALQHSPNCALAHGLIALCHSPNYNFKGKAYYQSTCHVQDINTHDLLCVFPSQYVADRHSKLAVEKVEELRKLHRNSKGKKRGKKGGGGNKRKMNEANSENGSREDPAASNPEALMIPDVESQLIAAIRIVTCCPGVDPDLSDETVGRPYADAMRTVYKSFPHDPEVAWLFAESLMILNAWKLYEYPSGRPVSPDVVEVRQVLEASLLLHPDHAGLCHMYVHLSEMSAHPELALKACEPLRYQFPHAGHLIHMATHIDVLVGDYEACYKFNRDAVAADGTMMECSPATAGKESFYFGYIVHNFHMAVYGAILGGFEAKALEVANELKEIVNEDMFAEFVEITSYLETYSALEVHTMIRFGRWKELLQLEMPKDKNLMLYRAASIRFARGLAYAATGNLLEARKEADRFDSLRQNPETEFRILHNNTVKDLLAVDAVMLRGEIAYREEKYEEAFTLLRRAVEMQDDLNYDEPWGKMVPIRHSLGGLLFEQGYTEEATAVFRKDLIYHPKNPWALVGLIRCLKAMMNGSCCGDSSDERFMEITQLEEQLRIQRQSELADFEVVVACECCQHPE